MNRLTTFFALAALAILVAGSVPASAHVGRVSAGISIGNPGLSGGALGDVTLAGNTGNGAPAVMDSVPPPPPPPPPPPGDSGHHGFDPRKMDSLRHVLDSLHHVRDSVNKALLDSLHKLRDTTRHHPGRDTLRQKHRDSMRLRDSIIRAHRDSLIHLRRDTLHVLDSIRHHLRDSIIHSWIDSMRIRDSIIRARLDSLWRSDTTHHRHDSIRHEVRGIGDEGRGLALTAASVPTGAVLAQNYPNPFNPTTQISFTLPSADAVTLTVFSATGRQVATLVNESLSAGEHTVTFDASQFPSGIYWYRLATATSSQVRRMLLTK